MAVVFYHAKGKNLADRIFEGELLEAYSFMRKYVQETGHTVTISDPRAGVISAEWSPERLYRVDNDIDEEEEEYEEEEYEPNTYEEDRFNWYDEEEYR